MRTSNTEESKPFARVNDATHSNFGMSQELVKLEVGHPLRVSSVTKGGEELKDSAKYIDDGLDTTECEGMNRE